MQISIRNKPAVDALLKAREKIANGWTKGSRWRTTKDGDLYCAIGPLDEESNLDVRGIARGLLSKAMANKGIVYGIIEFNDRPSTTKQDVLDLYDDAIALAEMDP
jgi:hypothetical protein